MDAARFFLVMRSQDQTLDLDLGPGPEQSQENPVYYVQYAHARIASILRNVPEGTEAAVAGGPGVFASPYERALIKRLESFADVVQDAAERRAPAPHRRLRARSWPADFHVFYKHCRVIGCRAGCRCSRAGSVPGDQAGHRSLPRPAGCERSREHVAGAARCPSSPKSRRSGCQLERRLLGLRFATVERTEPAMLRDCTRRAGAWPGCPEGGSLSVDRLGKFIIVEARRRRLSHPAPGHDRPVADRPGQTPVLTRGFMLHARRRRQTARSRWSSGTSASSAGCT